MYVYVHFWLYSVVTKHELTVNAIRVSQLREISTVVIRAGVTAVLNMCGIVNNVGI